MKKILSLIILMLIITFTVKSQEEEQIIPDQFIYISAQNCTAELPNYLDNILVIDNCGVNDVTQNPPAGTILDATNPQHTVVITATDDFNNVTTTSFMVTLLDTIPPRIEYNYLSYTLGNTDVYGSQANTTQRRAVPFYATTDGTVTYLNIYHVGPEDSRMILAVYSDKDGKPDSLLTKTEEIPMANTAGWQRVPVIHPASFKIGKVWLAWNSSGTSGFRYESGHPVEFGRVAAAENYTLADGMPEFFGEITDGTPSTATYSIYMEYTRGLITYTPEMIKDMYKIVEFYVAGQVEDFTYEFGWSTYGMDKVFYMPKSKPANTIY